MSPTIPAVVFILVCSAACSDHKEKQESQASSPEAVNESRVQRLPEQGRVSRNATTSEILALFREADSRRLYNSLVQLTVFSDNEEVINVLKDVWAVSRERHPEFNWKGLTRDEVRVAVAQVLGSLDPSNFAEYRAYVRDQLASSDELVAFRAGGALGAMGAACDFDALVATARGTRDLAAVGAITGLVLLGTEEGRDAVTALAEDSQYPEKRRETARQALHSDLGKTALAEPRC